MDKPFCMRHYALMQGACAMRISTDALFLGAWARTAHTAGQVLDVGTGTGILSLMLAQTYPSAMVTAIDIDDEGVRTAQDNFSRSPYSHRLTALSCDITAPELALPLRHYDLIVSNPPYYDGLQPATASLRQARHMGEGFAPHLLFRYLESLVAPKPTICLVTPIEALPLLRREAVLHRYNLTRLCWLHHHVGQLAIRILTQWHRSETPSAPCLSERLAIRTAQQRYTVEACDLLRPYLLDEYLD